MLRKCFPDLVRIRMMADRGGAPSGGLGGAEGNRGELGHITALHGSKTNYLPPFESSFPRGEGRIKENKRRKKKRKEKKRGGKKM